ncbi:hypothetical protein C488_14202 [Natrinema pellirubrum DSM 15624]|uniref:Uncharacterized protein n=1 Tax=Natrinema pellirubrum (strain DSM 15624 / CIP 106293 / JCM 10476 / NCIMB 786 / 157) TaxID=797303 RepID=L9YGC8_NATP1|nr:hypothetical protein C488_14202 [Natrinema pellirubrum DSM 15624]
MPPLVGGRIGDRRVLDARLEVETVWSDEELKHPQRRVVRERLLGVPEAAAGVHHQQVFGIGNEFVPLPVVVTHHPVGNPRDDLLVAVLMHPDQCSRIHERLDDRRKRTVSVVVVARDRTAGEIEMDPELALIL